VPPSLSQNALLKAEACIICLKCDLFKVASLRNPYDCGCVRYFAMLGMLAGSFMSLLPYLLICSVVLPAVVLSSPTCCFAQQSYLMFRSAVELLQLQGSLVCQHPQYESPASLQAYSRPLQGARQWARPQVPGGLLLSCPLLMAALKVGPAISSVPVCPCCMQAQHFHC